MTQEEKQLLLKDICARLPYGVKVKCERYSFPVTVLYAGNVDEVKFKETGGIEHICLIKPYLRPMSSMTEEEKEEYWNTINLKSPEMPVGEIPSIETIAQCSIIVLDWLLSKGFDIRGLIPMGLALEALEGMYKIE